MIKFVKNHIKFENLNICFLFDFSEFAKTLGVPGKPTGVFACVNRRLSIKSRISSEILALRNLKVSINFDENQNSDIFNFKSEVVSELPRRVLVRHAVPQLLPLHPVLLFPCLACVDGCLPNHSIASSFADKPAHLSPEDLCMSCSSCHGAFGPVPNCQFQI